MLINWTVRAGNDLAEITQYLLASDRIHIAKSTSERILVAVEQLKKFPNIGKIGRIKNTRELVMPDMPFVIVYSVDENINILRVIHTARFWNT